MTRQPNKSGGGKNTTINGHSFDNNSKLKNVLAKRKGIIINGRLVFKNGKQVGIIYDKNEIYTLLLNAKGIDHKTLLSKKIIPDESILIGKILYIFEKKWQCMPGSVDEKLQSCEYKKIQFQKLFENLGIKVKYCYILCDWFKRNEYNDVREYIKQKDCNYFYNKVNTSYLHI